MNKNYTYKSFKNFHFRHHKRKQHNVLIIGENKLQYQFMPTSSNPKRDKQHSNYEFIYHPKKRLNQKKLNLKDKSYLEKKVIIGGVSPYTGKKYKKVKWDD